MSKQPPYVSRTRRRVGSCCCGHIIMHRLYDHPSRVNVIPWYLPRFDDLAGDVDHGGPENMYEASECVFDPLPKMPHSKLLSDNSASFTSWRVKDLCQKWKRKPIFSRRLKQFDGLTWLAPTLPLILRHWSSGCLLIQTRTVCSTSPYQNARQIPRGRVTCRPTIFPHFFHLKIFDSNVHEAVSLTTFLNN